ncbi:MULTISPECIES: hypothetical protein [Halobacterium]|nr:MULTISPECIES: hypothetical protein [Halobacterium]MBB6090732.1 hypothetical protein [Halobacterium salinarum]MCF2164188.1 hypothetical protein [Halobacterium salinarum]MCF2166714.1 hypothetical protein [Halobacterium salinarum]MCF2208458.1 hypothetical protein [Halobacterium salinarum]MCF2237851.1 hypothetical protein [Halobacterium salinarum]
MATREGEQSFLADRMPLPVDAAQSLSWALGSEIAAEKPECARLEHADWSCSVTVFEATPNTVIARFRTAVGRESFFGLARADVEDVLARAPGGWQVTDAER